MTDDRSPLRVICAEPACKRTGTVYVDAGYGLRRYLGASPWRCVYHDVEFVWHTDRPDRRAAQSRAR